MKGFPNLQRKDLIPFNYRTMPFPLQNWNTLISMTLQPTDKVLSLTGESIRTFIEKSSEEQDKVRTLLLEGILEPGHANTPA